LVGRGSSIEAFPLFGYDLQDYDDLFAEKLDLLLKIREDEFITWSANSSCLKNLPVSKTIAGSDTYLVGRRWYTRIVHSGRYPRATAHGSDHWR
jgi:hypothetical protein